ncbi:MAG TPA: hypothetical protein VNL16_08245 [Chloroflexota bacterium]|nr:hypothetical protein [Chloroflexota bacterium]
MPVPESDHRLANAVRATVVYADLFDFPLRRDEIHRDLIGTTTTVAETNHAIQAAAAAGDLTFSGDFVVLPGRADLRALRRVRSARAARLWPTARRFGGIIAAVPFARVVAVTGSLAADNPSEGADLDYLVVTAPGRLWLVRAMAIAVVRLARPLGVRLCPNYLLSSRALMLDHDDLFTAHELLQAVPIAGSATYLRMLASNRWARRWLPNRFRQAENTGPVASSVGLARRAAEAVLAGSLGDRLEGWEARRKRRRLGEVDTSARFTADLCEGYFGNHRLRVLQDFALRCAHLGITPSIADDSPARHRERGVEGLATGPRLLTRAPTSLRLAAPIVVGDTERPS